MGLALHLRVKVRPSPVSPRAIAQSLEGVLDHELEQMMVCGALVSCEENHYRIESGDETWEELEAFSRLQEGRCDCGSLLSSVGDRHSCRSCGREYRF